MQEVFKRIQDSKRELKGIKQIVKDFLSNSMEYSEINKDIDALKIKKAKVEEIAKVECKEELARADQLKLSIESDNQLLTDISLATYVKGESVRVVDDSKIEYEPRFSVKFKKR